MGSEFVFYLFPVKMLPIGVIKDAIGSTIVSLLIFIQRSSNSKIFYHLKAS